MRIQQRESDATRAYMAIRKSIINGLFKPGERLVENRLSEQLGVSRTPIREALAMLEAEGIVKAIPKHGSVVRSYSQAELEAMYDLRALLEGHAAQRAAKFISDKDIDRLEQICREMGECIAGAGPSLADQPKRIRYLGDRNNDFHRIIARAGQNPLIENTIRSVVELPLVFKAFFWYSQEQLERSHQHHQKLIEAMRSRDSKEAERIMVEHIDGALEVLLKHLGTDAINGEKDAAVVMTSASSG